MVANQRVLDGLCSFGLDRDREQRNQTMTKMTQMTQIFEWFERRRRVRGARTWAAEITGVAGREGIVRLKPDLRVRRSRAGPHWQSGLA
jgi:hypothetical protein